MSKLLEEAAAYLAGPPDGASDLIRRLRAELSRSLLEEERLALEVRLCRRRPTDLLHSEPHLEPSKGLDGWVRGRKD